MLVVAEPSEHCLNHIVKPYLSIGSCLSPLSPLTVWKWDRYSAFFTPRLRTAPSTRTQTSRRTGMTWWGQTRAAGCLVWLRVMGSRFSFLSREFQLRSSFPVRLQTSRRPWRGRSVLQRPLQDAGREDLYISFTRRWERLLSALVSPSLSPFSVSRRNRSPLFSLLSAWASFFSASPHLCLRMSFIVAFLPFNPAAAIQAAGRGLQGRQEKRVLGFWETGRK